MNLLTIESSGKAKNLSVILGSAYKIIALIVHVPNLPTHECMVAAPNFGPA